MDLEPLRRNLDQRVQKPLEAVPPLLRAGVLIPLVPTTRGLDVLLTRRTDTVLTHKGQISFPGGQIEESDQAMVQTALRETYEEIGLEPSRVEVIGELDDVLTAVSGFVVTPFVGVVSRCTHCSVPLIYHASQRQLVCHYCNFQLVPPELCESCKKGYVRFRGSGTERVESELHRLFPVASIGRMDRDTTKQRESHRQIYEAVKRRQIGLLVGTQMIAKGFDFPQVTVVGVISADTALNLPDFRSGEQTFDLLTQVAGRAGRGDQPGQVFLQTYCPTHYAIQAAQAHDYQRFYDAEIEMRRRVQLPPFVHLIELTLMGASKPKVFEAADALAVELRRLMAGGRLTLLGPAPHRIPRLRRAYRACLLLKGRAVEPMMRVLRGALQPGRRFRGMPVSVNVDPL